MYLFFKLAFHKHGNLFMCGSLLIGNWSAWRGQRGLADRDSQPPERERESGTDPIRPPASLQTSRRWRQRGRRHRRWHWPHASGPSGFPPTALHLGIAKVCIIFLWTNYHVSTSWENRFNQVCLQASMWSTIEGAERARAGYFRSFFQLNPEFYSW